MKAASSETVKGNKGGRPRIENPQQNYTVRLSGDLVEAIDAWAREHGNIGRAAAVRLAIAQLVRGHSLEKSI